MIDVQVFFMTGLLIGKKVERQAVGYASRSHIYRKHVKSLQRRINSL